MGSRRTDSSTIKRESLKKLKPRLDRLTTREAQILRMRHGITEPPSAPVAEPSRDASAELRERLKTIEDEIIDRIRNESSPDDAKSKIVDRLKRSR